MGKSSRPASSTVDPLLAALPPHRRGHKIAQWKPIMDAAFAGDAPRIKKLLTAGADPNVISTTPSRYRPLHRAIEHKKTSPRNANHEAAVRTLLAGRADPVLRGGYEQLTALALAAIGETRFIAIFRELFLPLDIFHACVLGDEPRVAALLKKDKALAKSTDSNGWTPLHYCANSALFQTSHAARKSPLSIARRLLAAGAEVTATYNYPGNWPIPILYGCCGRHDFPELAELLIHAGANPCDNESVYHAADEGHVVALAVIERLTDPKQLAAECSKCLVSQIHFGHTRAAPWLLAHGADPNFIHPRFGNTALHEAALRGTSEDVLKLLLAAGAKPGLKNAAGKTAIELAKKAAVKVVLRGG